MLAGVVDGIARGTAVAHPQQGEPTYAGKPGDHDGRIRWDEPAQAVLLGRVRGVTPGPGAHTTVAGTRVKVLAAGPRRRRPAPGRGGAVSAGAGGARGDIDGTGRARSRAARREKLDDRRGLVSRPPRRRGCREARRMSGASNSRRVAFETLRAVHESDAYANLLLARAIERAGLDTADAGFATASRTARSAVRAPTTRSSRARRVAPATGHRSRRPRRAAAGGRTSCSRPGWPGTRR